ncbi:hypothetical protein FRB99_001442 [Tulasnella sp. 403]|nr:hypothetical protein FRB99_001442 [Tulasnella sp. 403]
MFEANAQVVCFGVTHFLVALRVRALWATKPWLDKLLLVTGVTYFVLTLTFTNVASIKVLHTLVWNSEFNLCFATPPEWTYVVWIPALVFEVMVFGFMITKAMQHARRHVAMPVAQVLYRDGVLYFGVIAACSVFNILAWSVLPKTLILLAKYFTFSFINAMSSRLVLNLRGMGRERDKGPWTTDQSKGAVELYNFRPSTALSGRPNVKGSIMAYQPPKPLPVLPKPPTVLTRKQSILRSMDRHGDVTASNTTGTESRLGFYPVTASLQIQVDVDVDVDGDEGDETSCSDTHPSNEKMGWESEPPV